MRRLRPAVYRQVSPSPAISPAPHDRSDAFEDGLRAIARNLRDSVPNLTAREQEWLYDLARDECRYPMPTVRKLCALSRRSRTPEHRNAFAELIRTECFGGEQLGVARAFDLETPAPGLADVEQRQFERSPNPITFARCKAALTRQLAVTRVALDALLGARMATWE